MNSIHDNEALREALHSVYVAQFQAWRACPDGFTKADLTRLVTSLLGARPWSWRVIGITPGALEEFAACDFSRPARQLQRGHRVDRSSTAMQLFDRENPMPLREFFAFYLERDVTVIMTNAENRHRPGSRFPSYISIDSDLGLFPSGTLVGWQHRKTEVAFLRDLHARHAEGKTTMVADSTPLEPAPPRHHRARVNGAVQVGAQIEPNVRK